MGRITISKIDDGHDDDAELQLNATMIHESLCFYSEQ